MVADRHITLKAFTLSAIKVRDSDRLLKLLTRSRGVLTAYAGGAARPNSRFLSCSLAPSLSEFELYVRGDRVSVRGADLIYGFAPLKRDIVAWGEAERLARLFSDAATYDQGDSAFFDLYGYALYALIERPDKALVSALAALRLVAEIGLFPHLGTCVTCHAPLQPPYHLSLVAGGTLCRAHARAHVTLDTLTPDLVRLLIAARERPLPRLFTLTPPLSVVPMFVSFVWRYVAFQLESAYPTWDWAMEPMVRTEAQSPAAPPASDGDASARGERARDMT